MTGQVEPAASGRGRVSVSVVIPTFNRLPRLIRVLEALGAQAFDGALEVVVVSDGSTDGTDEYLSSGRTPVPVVLGQQVNQGPAAARNRGIELASGDLVLFIDDDVVPAPDLVEQHERAHQRLGPDVVVLGPMLSPPGYRMSPWVSYEQAMLTKQYDAMVAGAWEPTARQFYTGNASVERSHLLAAGGFDVAFRRAEDVELAYRLRDKGIRFAFVPEAVGHHYAERSYASWRDTAYRYGRSDVVFSRDKGQPWLLDAVEREFSEHHLLTRLLVRACVDRPWLFRPAVALGGRVATAAGSSGLEVLSRAALSAVYNVTYYQGIADELGRPLASAGPTRVTRGRSSS